MNKDEAVSIQKTVVRNIKFLAKLKGIKLRDIENGCGVEPGFFSRIAAGSIKTLRFTHVLIAADMIGAKLDDLTDTSIAMRMEIASIDEQIEALSKRRKELTNDLS